MTQSPPTIYSEREPPRQPRQDEAGYTENDGKDTDYEIYLVIFRKTSDGNGESRRHRTV